MAEPGDPGPGSEHGGPVVEPAAPFDPAAPGEPAAPPSGATPPGDVPPGPEEVEPDDGRVDPTALLVEREVKLSPPPGWRLPELSEIVPGVTAVPRPEQQLDATYYDTSDLRLARSGASLRHRTDEGWTVKLPMPDRLDAALARAEVAFEGPRDAPPRGARDLVTALVREAPLVPVVRLHTQRLRVDLVDVHGRHQAEIVDDTVVVRDDLTARGTFREVEIELAPDAPDELGVAIAHRLEARGVGRPDPTPKVTRALGPRAHEPPDVTISPVGPHATAGEMVRRAIAASVARLVAHDPFVRLGHDPEAVHQARVATRRLRSDLRTFLPLVDPAWAEPLREELRWLGNELGAVRDVEVLLQRLEDAAVTLPAPDRLAAERVLARLRADWADARSHLLDALRTPRYVALLERLVAAANRPALLPDAGAPARDVLPGLVRRPWRALRRAVRGLGSEPDDAALHSVRIRVKRCRYAAEAVAPAVGPGATELARRLAGLQDVLGDFHDAAVADQWILARRDSFEPAELFAAGQLAGLERADAARLRRAWRKAWRRARRRRLRAWM